MGLLRAKKTKRNRLRKRTYCAPDYYGYLAGPLPRAFSQLVVKRFTIWKMLSPAVSCRDLANMSGSKARQKYSFQGTSGETEAQKQVV